MLLLLQVAVPEHVAKILTYRERVTKANLQMMKQLVVNGSVHPGAIVVEHPEMKDGQVTYHKRYDISVEICVCVCVYTYCLLHELEKAGFHCFLCYREVVLSRKKLIEMVN